jgi:hypothetical protein
VEDRKEGSLRPRQLESRLEVRIPKRLKARLVTHARQEGIPLAEVVRSFLLAGLASQQPPLSAQEAEALASQLVAQAQQIGADATALQMMLQKFMHMQELCSD